MTGLQVLVLVLALYCAFEAVAIPLGHLIGKRAGGLRGTLLVVAGAALLVASVALLVNR